MYAQRMEAEGREGRKETEGHFAVMSTLIHEKNVFLDFLHTITESQNQFSISFKGLKSFSTLSLATKN